MYHIMIIRQQHWRRKRKTKQALWIYCNCTWTLDWKSTCLNCLRLKFLFLNMPSKWVKCTWVWTWRVLRVFKIFDDWSYYSLTCLVQMMQSSAWKPKLRQDNGNQNWDRTCYKLQDLYLYRPYQLNLAELKNMCMLWICAHVLYECLEEMMVPSS